MLVKLSSGLETPDAGILQGPIVVILKTFIEGMKYVFVCLRVCLCVLACVAVCVGWVLTVVFFVYFLGVTKGHPHSHSILVSNRSSVPMGNSCTRCLHWPWVCRVVEREWRAKQEVAVCELQSQTESCKEKI